MFARKIVLSPFKARSPEELKPSQLRTLMLARPTFVKPLGRPTLPPSRMVKASQPDVPEQSPPAGAPPPDTLLQNVLSNTKEIGVLQGGFVGLSAQLSSLATEVSGVKTSITGLEAKFTALEAKLTALEAMLKGTSTKSEVAFSILLMFLFNWETLQGLYETVQANLLR